MNAIVLEKYGPPNVLQFREVEKATPKANEVLIRIYAAAVTATDPVDRKGEPFVARIFSGIRRPKHPIPGGMLAGVLTALPFLRDEAKIRRGQNVLIIGASGSVGVAAVQLAKYYGAEVTGVSSTLNLEMVRALGADKVIDYTQEDFSKTGQTYDVIFDAVGKSSFSRSKSSLKPGGVYLSTGPTVGGFFLNTMVLLFQMLWTSKIGNKRAKFAATGLRPSSEKTKDLALLNDLIEAGTIEPVIDRRYPLEHIVEAHRYVEKGQKRGNVVITVRDRNMEQ